MRGWCDQDLVRSGLPAACVKVLFKYQLDVFCATSVQCKARWDVIGLVGVSRQRYFSESKTRRERWWSGRCKWENDLPPLLEVGPSQKDPSFRPPRRVDSPRMADIPVVFAFSSDRGRQPYRQPQQPDEEMLWSLRVSTEQGINFVFTPTLEGDYSSQVDICIWSFWVSLKATILCSRCGRPERQQMQYTNRFCFKSLKQGCDVLLQ